MERAPVGGLETLVFFRKGDLWSGDAWHIVFVILVMLVIDGCLVIESGELFVVLFEENNGNDRRFFFDPREDGVSGDTTVSLSPLFP